MAEGIKGWIFDIQHYSINDGPGIRTTVFFKGCPLTCLWCSNFESQKQRPQLLYTKSLCTRCYRCVQACLKRAITVDAGGGLLLNQEACDACGDCVKACLSGARTVSGRLMTVEDVFTEIIKDDLFYRNSGGGVTASGGEPTEQGDFLIELFKKCQTAGIHTTLDTCGHLPWAKFERILSHVNLVLFDIKHLDPVKHETLTGVDNRAIVNNLRRLAESGVPVIVRIPLIPGRNDDLEHLEAVARLISSIGITRVDLLPYHQLGNSKYERLGQTYPLEGLIPREKNELEPMKAIFESLGLEANFV